jgi:hypothetical protein
VDRELLYENEWTRDDVGGQSKRVLVRPDVSARGGPAACGMASDFLSTLRTSGLKHYRIFYLETGTSLLIHSFLRQFF